MLGTLFGNFNSTQNGYVADATTFGVDGSMVKSGALTGAVASSTGILSMWIRIDSGDSSNRNIFDSGLNQVRVRLNTSNKFEFIFHDDDALTKGFQFSTSNNYAVSSSWISVISSWDTNFSAGNKISNLYINGSSNKVINLDADTAFNIKYNANNWGFGAQPGGGLELMSSVAEVYIAFGQFLDFTVPANIQKFRSLAGKPVSLGSDGSLPTGTAPTVYFKSPAASFNVNSGTGGNFTTIGSLTTASTSPSS